MYKNLILFRNELKNRTIPNYKIIGIVAELLLSKEIFPKNKNIEDFLVNIFELKFKAYIFRSRTLVVASVTRKLIEMDNSNSYRGKLYEFIEQKILETKPEKQKKNDFDGWIQL